jgi:hypothetical protein
MINAGEDKIGAFFHDSSQGEFDTISRRSRTRPGRYLGMKKTFHLTGSNGLMQG